MDKVTEIKDSFKKQWQDQDTKTAEKFEQLALENGLDEELKTILKKELGMNKWSVASHRMYARNYKSCDDFVPTGYKTEDGRNLVIFPKQSLNVITARTGHGKTQILINWCIDALRQSKKGNSKPIIFISLEMTKEQLAQRFINNLIYSECEKEHRRELPEYHRNLQIILEQITDGNEIDNKPHVNFTNIKNLEDSLKHDFYIARKNHEDGINLYKDLYFHALDILEEWQDNLSILDVDDVDNNLANVETFLNDNPNSIVFLDYLQYIRADQEVNHIGIKDICTTLKKSSAKNNQIIITAGQFNRDFDEDKNTYPEELVLRKLAEGSDIEKTSYNVFGLAYYTEYDEKKYYLKVMKQREGSDTGTSYKLTANMAYSYIEPLLKDENGIKETAQRPCKNKAKETIEQQTKSKGTIKIGKATLTEGGWNE